MDDSPIGEIRVVAKRLGQFRIILGRGFARDSVVIRYGQVELARRCGVSTRSDGSAGTILSEVPVGAVDHVLSVEVVGRLVAGSVELPPPGSGEAVVKVHLDKRHLQLEVCAES